MDTKWKNRKNAVSFMIFFLGVSLTLGGFAGILRDKPGGVPIWQTQKLFQGDYQQRGRFRDYVAGRFWSFLTMATGGSLEEAWGYDGYGNNYYYSGYEGVYEGGGWSSSDIRGYEENLEDMLATYQEMLAMWEELKAEGLQEEAEEFYTQIEGCQNEIESLQAEIERYQRELGIWQDGLAEGRFTQKEVSEEDRKKEKQRSEELARKFHDRIKGDRNLLYTISSDGKVLYTNSELLVPDGELNPPEGYNFLLYFDGEKVRIVKDGEELDVYGDGYYREENGWQQGSEWYVPGYRNFPVKEDMKKARILIAAAREPVLYMEGSYGNVSGQYDNSLYWMNYNTQANRRLLQKEAGCLVLGLLLLLLTLLGRKILSRNSAWEAGAGIARFQAKIWMECKLLLLMGMLWLLHFIMKRGSMEYGWWQELEEVWYYEYGADTISIFGSKILRNIHPVAWVILFWGIYLIWNDFRYNKGPWKNSLAGKIRRAFSAKGLNWPLTRRLARRNRVIFAGAAFYGLLTAGMALLWSIRCGTVLRMSGRYDTGALSANGRGGAIALALLAVLGAVVFLAVVFRVSAKNMETARDVEALSGCISEIRNGNYGESGGQFTGHDLEKVMEELEDIRHGLEKAVEEQMKSQRMKVELIANVSHDIKTPLTSIISYVQFLKQEEELPEHVKDYIKILDEKSQRLKNMVQDVFAVSKAASGELPMHMEELDFGKLLRQTLADMEEEIGGSDVSFRTEIPEEPVTILADGQRMYRVFQNLFQNAIKYSLAGSRVYVTLKADGALAVASVKNASRMELEKGRDFAERFTRGDASRTDGGSGLGLSIAQSFTEACGGTFSWETDADLFVVRVFFRRVEAASNEVMPCE